MHALASIVSAGLYAATGGDDGRVVVWMVESKMQVCGRFIDSFGSAAGYGAGWWAVGMHV